MSEMKYNYDREGDVLYISFGGALRIWDKLSEGFRRPAQQLPAQDAGDGYLADIIASQFQGALAADALVRRPLFVFLVISDEGGEAIGQLEQVQVFARRLNIFYHKLALSVRVYPTNPRRA